MVSTPPPVAGLGGLDHVGLTVPDMSQAVEFFVTVLGGETLHELGPVSAADNWMAVNLGVPADAVIARIVLLRVGPRGAALELFEYVHAEQAHAAEQRHPPSPDAVGGQHLAFRVEDIDAGVETLREHGLITLGEPKRVTEGPSAGRAWVHFLAPWGQQLELVSYPSGVVARAERGSAAGTPGRGVPEADEDDVGGEGAGADVDALRDTDGEAEVEPA